MGTDPLYLPAKFGDDTLKTSKVMDERKKELPQYVDALIGKL
jgi:hypothetical protein